MKQKPCSKPFVAFLLSFFMLIFALLGSSCFSIGSGSLSGGLKGMVNSIGVDDMVGDMLSSSMTNSNISGFEEIADSEAGQALINTVTDQFMDAIFTENGTVDSSKIEEKILDVVDSEVDKFIDDYTSEMDSNSTLTASDSQTLKDLSKKYGVALNDNIYNALDKAFNESGGTDKFKEEVKTALDENLLDELEGSLHEQMVKFEEEINTEIDEVHNSGAIDFSLFKKFEQIINIIKISGIVLLVLAAAMFALQFLIYKKGPYGVFRNGAIVMFIAAIPLMLVSMSTIIVNIFLALPPVKEAILDAAASGINLEQMLTEFVTSLVSPFRTLGIIYLVIVVICAVLAFVLKAQFKKKNASVNAI